MQRRRAWPVAVGIGLTLCAALSSCAVVGPRSLKADQVEYARALGEGKKREILGLMVGLRYADLPGFLNVSQIIAAYTFDAGGGVLTNTQPNSAFGATGSFNYSDHPTFTFAPTTGDYFAKAYIHPLAPALILPLANTGVPIDLLLRIAVQSIGHLQNATMLGGPAGNGSPQFFEMLRVLRRLQLSGALSVHYKTGNSDAVTIGLGIAGLAPTEDIAQDIREARTLLGLPSEVQSFDVVQGTVATRADQLPMVTRSVLAILSDLGGEVAVPSSDIESGATKPSLGLVGGMTRPIIVVHSTPKSPKNPYVEFGYRSNAFWIDDADFDSKYALTVVQELMALAEIPDNSHAPVVTVPAN